MASDLSSVLLPDVAGVADTADNEIVAIRAYLQQMAVEHNALVRGVGTFTEEQKAVNAQVVEATNGSDGLRQDINMIRSVVNANVKDQTDQMTAFRADADTTMIRAQLRVAGVEADVARLIAAQGAVPPGFG